MMIRDKKDVSWSPDFAYVIGLLTSDGNLSSDGRHIILTSKDIEIIEMTRSILGLNSKIGAKARGGDHVKKYLVLQFSNVTLYKFLLSIGLTPAKSRTLGRILIPPDYFPDFLRGCIDGDGSIGTFQHPESRHPQIRLRLCSASPIFLDWIHEMISTLFGIKGGFYYRNKRTSGDLLSFGSKDSLTIIGKMYYSKKVPCLTRKRLVAEKLMLEWRNW